MSHSIEIFRWFSRIGFFLLIIIAFWLSTIHAEDAPVLELTWDKLNHAFGYFALAALFDAGFATSRRIPAKAALVFFYSLALEICQYYLPHRDFSIPDIFANALGIGIFILVRLAIKDTRLYSSLQESG